MMNTALAPWVLASLLIATTAVSCKNAAPLELPMAVAVDASDEANVRDHIVAAMKRRSPGWRIVSEDTDARTMRVELVNRTHRAVADLDYSGPEVSFQHVGSENLRETMNGDGSITIHRAYNTWLGNLRNDIEDELRMARM